MKVLALTLVKGLDWEGLYAFGKLQVQGHRIDWERFLKKNTCMLSSTVYVDEQWLNTNGILPENLSEVVPRT